MMGSEIRPIEITEAATTPVVAASSVPTKITARARPPRTGPKSWPMVSSRSSAMPLRSSMSPISVKNGMASRVSFCMMPKMRSGRACSRASGSAPSSMPMKAKNRPQAPRLNATGKPMSRKTISPARSEEARRRGLRRGFGRRAQLDADEGEEQAAGPEAECHRKAHEQKDDQPREHDRGEVVGDEFHGGR